MRYISTRGATAQLDFVEVMLAGLARDGGLYVPTTWPTLSPAAIAGFAGRPYAEIAVEVLKPFVGDAIAEADLPRIAHEAYGSFRHPAVAPLVQLGDNLFVLELFHGPTLAFKDLAMQLVARLMDHVLKKRGERTTIVVATSGDTGGAAVDDPTFAWDNMLPGEYKSVTVDYKNDGTEPQDVYLTFPNLTALSALNTLGTYGEVHVSVNGTEVYANANLNDKPNNGTTGLPAQIKLQEGLAVNHTGTFTFQFRYADKLGGAQGATAHSTGGGV